MQSLRELQLAVGRALIDESGAGHLLAHCAGDAHRASRGLRAYRQSVHENLAAAVQSTYPVIEAIVGHDFLQAAARRYAGMAPSLSGNLNDFGAGFPHFLATFPAADALPYLPDVARLEWRIHRVYGAADPPAQQLETLALAPPDTWPGLRFLLDRAHALLASRWPVVRIWEVNQAGHAGPVTVNFDQPESALIHRRSRRIVVEPLLPAEYAWLASLASGRTLGESVEDALEAGEIDLMQCLQRIVANGLVRGIH